MAEIILPRVIIDVDEGIDDYLAILILFYAQLIGLIKIEAICCSKGNTEVENVCINVIRQLELFNRTDIPVYQGSSSPIILPDLPAEKYYGKDGFGDLNYTSNPDISLIKSEPSAVAISTLIKENPNQFTYINLGSLTNLALASKLNSKLLIELKDLWVMGGNYKENTAEFNFMGDPEAAHIILNATVKPLHLITMQTCLKPKISYSWRNNVWDNHKSDSINLFSLAENNTEAWDEFWVPCDAFAAFSFVNPQEHITLKSLHYGSVALHSNRAQLIIDDKQTINPKNLEIVEAIDAEKFKQYLLKMRDEL